MESKNHRESDLRELDLMQAYLRDETSEMLVEEIEEEMERDPLYHLAMEALAHSSLDRTSASLTQLEEAFPALLIQAKEQFVAYLDTHPDLESPPATPTGNWLANLPAWQKWFGSLALLLFVASLVTLPLLMSGPDLHKDPALHLVVDGDQLAGISMLQECESKRPGIGRGKEVTFSSTLVETYASGKYGQAIREFRQLEKMPGLGDACLLYTKFYLAKSFMMEGDYSQAIATFKLISEHPASPASLVHAAHWYLGNLALAQKEYSTASTHFDLLLESDPHLSQDHIGTLLQNNYLQEAKQYLNALKP
ncbi:MAG: hypothetical protein AAF587_38325 [Bacteroidota bacterium]